VEAKPKTIVHHLNDAGDPFDEWMESIRDPKIFAKLNIRLKRVAQGLLGDHGPVGEGVCELREHDGAAHRIYYGQSGNIVVLLTGGTKRTQVKDIERAKYLWREWNNA
jgi:putative addiction module killer protein